MINLRYHIVSLTAVFLALAIGVLLGGTYLDKYTVDQLDQSITNAERQIRETRAENDRLRGGLADAEARNKALIGGGTNSLFADNLTDVPVLVVAAEGVDENSRRSLVQALNASGAEFRGTLTVTGRVALDDQQAEALADELDLPSAKPARVSASLVERFAKALTLAGEPVSPADVPGDTASSTTVPAGTTQPGTEPATPPVTAAPDSPSTVPPGAEPPTTTVPEPLVPAEQPAVVTAMIDSGLRAFEAPADEQVSGPLLTSKGYRYVFLGGTVITAPETDFMVPVLRQMATQGTVPVVVASAQPAREGDDTLVARVRTDVELSRLVSTVDNLDWFNGIVSSVLALDEMGVGTRGHYGEGRGAAAPMPSGT